MEKAYLAIDLKSFYASVECVERGLDPLTARLVVADFRRTEKTICLAVSPALKEALGVPGRVRLYEVLQKARRLNVDFEAAPPRMQRYVEVSRQIYEIYTSFVAENDILPYSIDEVFIDATPYLKMYNCSARELAEKIIAKVYSETGITATAGIGTNMYLAKVAMDIYAKHMTPNEHGARVGELSEESYRRELWGHSVLTDFWRVGPGYKRRLNELGIYNMGDLARYSLTGSDKLYAIFGKNAELLIDHAWGWEPVTIQDVKSYESDNHSLSSGQVLHEPYPCDKARLIAWEMADALALELYERGLTTDCLTLTVGYDKDNPGYTGMKVRDHYGRLVPKPAHGTVRLERRTNSGRMMGEKILELFDELCSTGLMVRRIMISAEHVKQGKNGENLDVMFFQRDIFTDYEKIEREEMRDSRLAAAEIAIKRKYGKNAILKAANYEDGATMRERNNQLGGHSA
ncbi:DNA methylase [Candidatus Saccharibacteria bacterium]|nr:DNA methylase [Candidatus Saccharibacteria bacterium]